MNSEQRLLGRLVAIDMTSNVELNDAGKNEMLSSTYQYTTIGGTREIDRADNGDQIP
jgi:small nuclear ribonucleoprotein (snRNP)-like protein